MTHYKPVTFKKDKFGNGNIGGVPIGDLVAKYGTPLYVLDEETIRTNCKKYTESLIDSPFESQVLYAGKANLNIGLLNIIASEGLGLDVVSGGELYSALKSDINPSFIYFHGNNKSFNELELAIKNNVTLVLDNFQELENIINVVKETNLNGKIMIRLKPEIEAHTHEYIKTGQIDSKFGVEKESVHALISKIVDHSKLEFLGIHSHIGSQIFESKPYYELVDVMTDHLKNIKDICGVDVQQLNLGGGIGISYTEEDAPLDVSIFMKTLITLLAEACTKKGLSYPKLLFEPGRSIIGTAGITLYTIGTIKEIPDIRTYLFIDGGMADNPRPIMYKSEYTFDIFTENKEQSIYSIAGKFCESGDILAKDVTLPNAKVGDVLVVFGTGAYNYVMASNYNRACKPAMISVSNETSRTLVKRESFDDLIMHDVS
jgi:diaminopimelate decarboxylase